MSVAKRAKNYKATAERDEAGWWVATVRGVPGVHAQGRTLKQVRERAQEALEAAKPGAVVSHFELRPPALQAMLRQVDEARKRHVKSGAEVQNLLRRAARKLKARGVGRRDSGELLGMSFQRVQQLIEEVDDVVEE
jgi:predicted RNase H-like HicB family nuclease